MSRHGGRFGRLALLVFALVLVPASGASATTHVAVVAGVLTVTVDDGDHHFHNLDVVAGEIRLRDNETFAPAVQAGASCTNVEAKLVTCPLAGTTSVSYTGGSGSSFVVAQLGALPGTWDGAGGPDDLRISSSGADVLQDSGAGDETDSVSYDDAELGLPVTVTVADGAANDGPHGNDEVLDGFEAVSGGTADDTITLGGTTARAAFGRAGSDLLIGTDEDDRLTGNVGDDVLRGRGGDDTLIGNADEDVLDYSERSTPVDVDLGTAPDVSPVAGETDSVVGIEGVRGGPGADTLTGDGSANELYGGPGTDTLHGAGGDDVLDGGGDGDVLDGGAGARDLVTYASRLERVVVTIGPGIGDGVEGEGDDVQATVEGVVGSAYDDYLAGDGGANQLYGGDGDDQLDGVGGDDELYGEDGEDSLLQGADPDGADVLRGGADLDAAAYTFRAAAVTVTQDDTANDGATGEGDDVKDDVERILGGDADDTITGGDGPNELFGGQGADTLNGGGGDDLVRGDSGADDLSGGADDDVFLQPGEDAADEMSGDGGFDVVTYAQRDNPVRVTFDAVADDGEAGEGDLVDATVEGAIGGDGDDVLTGTGAANELSGGKGDDALAGGGGDDELTGGADDDALAGGTGDDTLLGEAGEDTFDQGATSDGADLIDGGTGDADRVLYTARSAGVHADSRLGGDGGISRRATDADDGAAGEGDDLVDVENLRGGSGPDELVGLGWPDELEGMGGADTLIGNGGPDKLDGGAGVDTIDAGNGNDTVEARDDLAETVTCGAGIDSARTDWSDTVSGCETNLATQKPADPPAKEEPTTTTPTTTTTPPSAPPAGGPPSATPPVIAADRSGPVVRVRGTRKLRRGGLVAVTITCSEACRGTLRLRAGRTALGSKPFTLPRAGSLVVHVRLSRANRRLLTRRGRLRITEAVEAVDAAGNRTAATSAFTLTP